MPTKQQDSSSIFNVKVKKMKTKYISKISAFMLGTILVFGCTEFDEFESADLGDAPALTLALVSAGDSSITVSMNSDAAGYIAAVLLSGVGNEVPEDAEALAMGNTVSDEYFYSKSVANQAVSYTFTSSVEQDASYEIMAVAANSEGVLGEIVVLEVTTFDTHAPEITGVSPGITYEPILEQGDTIILSFSEPVMKGSGKFSFETFFTGQTVNVPTQNVWTSGNEAFIVLPSVFPYREYIWLHWEQGAVIDASGNKADVMTTYFDSDNGVFVGVYWRMMSMNIAVQSVSPDEATSQTPGFDIVVSFAAGVNIDDLLDGDITLTYDDGSGVTTIIAVPVSEVSVSGSDVTIQQNIFSAVSGSVSIDIPEGVISDDFGNPNEAVSATWTLN